MSINPRLDLAPVQNEKEEEEKESNARGGLLLSASTASRRWSPGSTDSRQSTGTKRRIAADVARLQSVKNGKTRGLPFALAVFYVFLPRRSDGEVPWSAMHVCSQLIMQMDGKVEHLSDDQRRNYNIPVYQQPRDYLGTSPRLF